MSEVSPQAVTAELFRLYADEVYRYALFTLKNTTEAEDVTQEVFIRVLRGWQRFRNESGARTWIWTITRNCITDALRKRRRQAVPTEEPMDGAWLDPSLLEVKEALSTLDDKERNLVYLVILQGHSLTESTKLLGWSKSKGHRVIKRAVGKLSEYFELDEISTERGLPYELRTNQRTL